MRLKEWHKIALIIVLSLAGAYFFLRFFSRGISQGPPAVADNSILELTLSGEIAERTLEDPVIQAMGEPSQLSMQTLLQVIRKAKIDKKITGLILRPLGMAMGWAKAEELRDALADFKSSGKPVYAYLEVAGNKEYYLASVADSIVGLGSGMLFINGLASEPVFLKETLDKIGVEADFVAIGKYKNAPDMVTRKDMSEAQREVINSVLDQYYARFVSTLAAARGLDESVVRRHIDRGYFSLNEARSNGLIDTVMYYNEFKDWLKERGGRKSWLVSWNRYKDVPFSRLGISAKHTVAVVYGVGTIVVGGEDQFGQDGLITSEGMANSIRKAAEDKTVKAIILRIDSPGGSGTASDVIWREVVEARKQKPVIVSISDVAASGGYYISMAADTIVAHPNSIVGSIGVFAGKFAMKKLYDKIGMNKEMILRGKNADIFSEIRKFTPEQRELMYQAILEFYRDFIGKVAEGRDMSAEAVDAIGQGRVWTGEQGLQNGLVDVLGDFDTAVKIAKQMCGIPEDEPVRLAVYPKLKTFLERLFQGGFPSTRALETLFDWKQIPPAFRSIIPAIPHFRAGEPLYLYMYAF